MASIKHTEKLNKVSFFAIFGEAFVSREVLQLILIVGIVGFNNSYRKYISGKCLFCWRLIFTFLAPLLSSTEGFAVDNNWWF